ncbi:hypothetical protein K4K49_010206 [Colletotrichum sp. SAR 10_70]|nr:hypothetical protein K4K49_010206 [Colletotrichum sp. SAR 10_70]KAI8153605.1 hypothetical protein K4K50_008275 [Colletotrichum sp. SAR 10_71]
MPPNLGSNRMAQYARNPSPDSVLPDGAANLARNHEAERRSATPPAYQISSHAITDSTKLPAPKPFASARAHATHLTMLRQPPQSGLSSMQPLRVHSAANAPDASPRRHHHQRASSQSSDRSAFWPESQIDSQFGSPTTQRSEKYDAVMDIHSRLGSPPPTFATGDLPPLQTVDKLPYTISKNGAMRVAPSNDGLDLVSAQSDDPASVEPAAQKDAYSSEPYTSSPQRPVKLALHPATVRRSYAPAAYEDDQEVFSDSPTYKIPNNNLVRVEKLGQTQPTRHTANLGLDDEVEGSLASDYPLSEDDNGTPRANRKKALSREPALMENPLPAPSRTQRNNTKKRRRGSCDYADDELAGMTYSELREQAFDDDPTKKSLKGIGPLTGDSLPAKLDHFQGQREADQKQFFMQMPVSDWERSGDWFLEQFSQITQKVKVARQNKRNMVEQFENEIATREEAVRLRAESIAKKLNQIKHKGEDMLADKEF